jgi:DNA-binding response OmpR family regulator
VRLLIVDDHVDSADSLAVALRLRGHAGEVTLNGESAVTRFASAGPGHFDAAVIDMLLPGMGGLECLRRLRALPGGAGLPVVILTAWPDTREAEREAAGAPPARVIQKPCDLSNLLAVIESLRSEGRVS